MQEERWNTEIDCLIDEEPKRVPLANEAAEPTV